MPPPCAAAMPAIRRGPKCEHFHGLLGPESLRQCLDYLNSPLIDFPLAWTLSKKNPLGEQKKKKTTSFPQDSATRLSGPSCPVACCSAPCLWVSSHKDSQVTLDRLTHHSVPDSVFIRLSLIFREWERTWRLKHLFTCYGHRKAISGSLIQNVSLFQGLWFCFII